MRAFMKANIVLQSGESIGKGDNPKSPNGKWSLSFDSSGLVLHDIPDTSPIVLIRKANLIKVTLTPLGELVITYLTGKGSAEHSETLRTEPKKSVMALLDNGKVMFFLPGNALH